MNRNKQVASDSVESTAIDVNRTGSQEADANAPDTAHIRHRSYDGREPLDPTYETIAQFFATPRQFGQFESVTALAEHLGVSRMTIYRRAERADVMQRTKWLLEKSMRLGDLIASREWPGIIQAQVDAALKGDVRAARFCEKRAWRQSSNSGFMMAEPRIEVATILGWLSAEINAATQEEELDLAEDPETECDNNPQE